MSWIIVTTLTLSFAWVWSRWLTGRDAWKNDYLDYSVGIIAISSWMVNTTEILLNPNLSAELANEYHMFGSVGVFLITVACIGIWIGITWIFVRFREKIARSHEYKNENNGNDIE